MAWSFIDSNEYNSVSSSSATLATPTGSTTDDIMYVVIGRKGYNAEPTTVPTGWTRVAFAQDVTADVDYVGLYRRVIASGDGTSHVWEWTAGACNTGAVIVTFRDDFDTSDPEDVISNTDYIVEDTNVRAAGFTISADSSPVIHFAIRESSLARTFTAPSGFAEHYDAGSTDSDFWFGVFSDTLDSGATGDVDAITSLSGYDKHAFMVALNPPSVGGVLLPVMGL